MLISTDKHVLKELPTGGRDIQITKDLTHQKRFSNENLSFRKKEGSLCVCLSHDQTAGEFL